MPGAGARWSGSPGAIRREALAPPRRPPMGRRHLYERALCVPGAYRRNPGRRHEQVSLVSCPAWAATARSWLQGRRSNRMPACIALAQLVVYSRARQPLGRLTSRRDSSAAPVTGGSGAVPARGQPASYTRTRVRSGTSPGRRAAASIWRSSIRRFRRLGARFTFLPPFTRTARSSAVSVVQGFSRARDRMMAGREEEDWRRGLCGSGRSAVVPYDGHVVWPEWRE